MSIYNGLVVYVCIDIGRTWIELQRGSHNSLPYEVYKKYWLQIWKQQKWQHLRSCRYWMVRTQYQMKSFYLLLPVSGIAEINYPQRLFSAIVGSLSAKRKARGNWAACSKPVNMWLTCVPIFHTLELCLKSTARQQRLRYPLAHILYVLGFQALIHPIFSGGHIVLDADSRPCSWHVAMISSSSMTKSCLRPIQILVFRRLNMDSTPIQLLA